MQISTLDVVKFYVDAVNLASTCKILYGCCQTSISLFSTFLLFSTQPGPLEVVHTLSACSAPLKKKYIGPISPLKFFSGPAGPLNFFIGPDRPLYLYRAAQPVKTVFVLLVRLGLFTFNMPGVPITNFGTGPSPCKCLAWQANCECEKLLNMWWVCILINVQFTDIKWCSFIDLSVICKNEKLNNTTAVFSQNSKK